MLNETFHLRDKGLSNALGIEALARHRWYFVKEGFSPKLVEQALESEGVAKGELLLDPFAGSGTAPLTGALCGMNVRAFEINPFLRFLSGTKLIQLKPSHFRATARRVAETFDQPVPSPLEGYSTFTKDNRWGRWLFPTDVLRTYEAGRKGLRGCDPRSRNLVGLALLGSIMDCCNAERDGKCLRYLKDWSRRQSTATDFKARFERRCKEIEEDLRSAPIVVGSSHVKAGDARVLVKNKMDDKFRLCITSPPYLNSFDYSDIYRPELFLGGFVRSNKALMKIRLQTVRSHLQAQWKSPVRNNFGSLYSDCISLLEQRSNDLWNARIPVMVQAYFEDMEKIFRGLRKSAKRNASLWIVVSTSAYAGVEIPVDLVLADVGQRNGWFLREVGVLRYLRSSSQHFKHINDETRTSVPLRESVVIFDASNRRT